MKVVWINIKDKIDDVRYSKDTYHGITIRTKFLVPQDAIIAGIE